MPFSARTAIAFALAGFASLTSLTSSSRAVVKHLVDDAVVIQGPDVDVVGRWGTTGSAVAIDPNYVITAAHTSGGVGTQVVFGGTTYQVAQRFVDPTGADLAVARIETLANQPANLTDFVPVYTTPITVFTNFTMGGFGKGRGTDRTATLGGTYGYDWLNETNINRRFGRNVIDGIALDAPGLGFTSDVYTAHFDGPGTAGSLTGESILAEFDSGGGWFIEDGPGNWKVAAINRAVEHNAYAQFADPTNASIPDPDYMDAVNLSSYTAFINSVVPEPAGTALLAVAAVLARRRRR